MMFPQEILEEVFRELHKVRDEIIDGRFTLLKRILNKLDNFRTNSHWLPLAWSGDIKCDH